MERLTVREFFDSCTSARGTPVGEGLVDRALLQTRMRSRMPAAVGYDVQPEFELPLKDADFAAGRGTDIHGLSHRGEAVPAVYMQS